MKLRNLFLIIIIIAALMLSGCGQQTTTKTTPYVGGTEGLTMEFQEGQPPLEIFDEGTMPFTVGILLKNKGEHGIFDETYELNEFEDFGRLTLRGINPVYFDITNDETILDFKTKGISLMAYRKNPADGTELQGGIASAQFPTLNYLHDSQGNNDLTLGVDMCYNYRTKSTTNICVVKDIQNRKNKICDPFEEKETSNSGAPVHVKSIIQAPAGQNKLSLIINIEKVNDGGTVFRKVNPDTITNDDLVCDESPTNQDKNKVFVRVNLPDGDDKISCSEFGGENEGDIMLNVGQVKPVVCSLDIEEVTQDYVTALYVDLEYSFGQYMDKTIQLKDYE